MKKLMVATIMVFCMTICTFSCFTVEANAAVSKSTNVYNKIVRVKNDLNSRLKVSGVFTTDGKDCNSGHTNCDLYNILDYIGEGSLRSKTGWGRECNGFVRYMTVKTFNIPNSSTIDKYLSDATEYNFRNLKTGDVILSDHPHAMVFISCNSSGVRVLDANGAGDMKIREVTYSYSHPNLEGSITVWSIPTDAWKKVNGASLKLSAPTIKVSSDSYGRNVISWNAVSGASKYEVYRKVNGGSYSRIYSGTSRKVTNTKNIKNGTTYYYKVKAIDSSNSSNNSAYSNIVSRTYNAKIPLTISNSSTSGKPYLKWGSYSGAYKYKVYAKTGSNAYSLIYTTKGNSLTHSSAIAGNLYYYRVYAVNSSGSTLVKSDEVERTCDFVKPKMRGASCVPSTGAIKISFYGVKGANMYRIYRATSKTGTYKHWDDLKLISKSKGGEVYYFVNTNSTPGKTYYYKVKAATTKNIGADSLLSSGYVYITRDLASPSIKIVGDSKGRNVISWAAVSGASKYEVYRSVDGKSYSRIYSGKSRKVTNTKNIKNGTKYYYKVRAICSSNSYANSAYSNIVSRTYYAK